MTKKLWTVTDVSNSRWAITQTTIRGRYRTWNSLYTGNVKVTEVSNRCWAIVHELQICHCLHLLYWLSYYGIRDSSHWRLFLFWEQLLTVSDTFRVIHNSVAYRAQSPMCNLPLFIQYQLRSNYCVKPDEFSTHSVLRVSRNTLLHIHLKYIFCNMPHEQAHLFGEQWVRLSVEQTKLHSRILFVSLLIFINLICYLRHSLLSTFSIPTFSLPAAHDVGVLALYPFRQFRLMV